jgi:hypothetical protein
MSRDWANRKHKEIPSDGIKRGQKPRRRFFPDEYEEEVNYSEQGNEFLPN